MWPQEGKAYLHAYISTMADPIRFYTREFIQSLKGKATQKQKFAYQ
jgi:hypothetical protein